MNNTNSVQLQANLKKKEKKDNKALANLKRLQPRIYTKQQA